MDIGEKISYLRSTENLSQSKLAEIIFVSRQAISRWENGHTHPEIETVKLLSKTFDYPLEWFLTKEYGVDYLTDCHKTDVLDAKETGTVNEKSALFKDVLAHLKVNKWIAVSYLLIAFFPGLFIPRLLLLTLPVAVLALYTTYNRLLIGVLLSLSTALTLLELFSLLALHFNWFVQTDIQEVINLIIPVFF